MPLDNTPNSLTRHAVFRILLSEGVKQAMAPWLDEHGDGFAFTTSDGVRVAVGSLPKAPQAAVDAIKDAIREAYAERWYDARPRKALSAGTRRHRVRHAFAMGARKGGV